VLAGKTVLVTGLLTERSIAWAVAREAQAAGATVIAGAHGRSARLTRRAVEALPGPVALGELDLERDADLDALAGAVREHADGLDGVLHGAAWGGGGLRDGVFAGSREEVARMFDVSAASYGRLAEAVVPLMPGGGSLVGLTFSPGVAWPGYDWMTVAKGALDALNRVLAARLGDRGIRANLVAAGPMRSVASEAFPRFEQLCDAWAAQAPLGWDADDATPVARAVCLLWSDHAAAITGSIVHADGGYHAVAEPLSRRFGAEDPAPPREVLG
jgi:enoyl-[acyl-carrier protein] reductase I